MKRELSKFELFIIGSTALSAGLNIGLEFAMYLAKQHGLELYVTIPAFLLTFVVIAFISAVLVEAIAIPVAVWVGKLLSRAKCKDC